MDVIKINRNRFNPEFIGIGRTVISKETDARSTALTDLDVSKLKHVLMVKDGEINVTGEERLKGSQELELHPAGCRCLHHAMGEPAPHSRVVEREG